MAWKTPPVANASLSSQNVVLLSSLQTVGDGILQPAAVVEITDCALFGPAHFSFHFTSRADTFAVCGPEEHHQPKYKNAAIVKAKSIRHKPLCEKL